MDIDEINQHIHKLKCGATDWQNIEKLAVLCTVRDELEAEQNAMPQAETVQETKFPEYTATSKSQSEFVEVASVAPFGALMDVLDEHMSAIKIVYPKEYELVIKRLSLLD